VAEDVAMAQRLFAHGRRTEVVLGPEQLTTRMYASLGEIVRGWRKNMYVGSMDVMPFGRAGRIVLAPLLLALPVLTLAPAVTLLAALALHMSVSVVIWAAVCCAILVLWWGFVYHEVAHASVLYALIFPLGAAVVLYIACGAIARGRSVEWKGRSYRAA
jgi:chlorobactene glucosyltransferase